MLIYNNTFENIKTIYKNFPIEDQYYAKENEAIIADGITRDPIGINDFSKCTEKEFIEKYPRPSGAELAAKEICNTFSKTKGLLKERLIKCNNQVKILNNKYIKECDYLENDYYGSVTSCISINNNILNYAYICDCGIIIYDKEGNIKFKTEDDKELYSDPYINKLSLSWKLPETRKKIRKDYRNNPNNIINGKCVSYGALTGEETAIYFIKSGQVNITKNDIVILYSDGFNNFLYDKEFINNIINFNKEKFEKYINRKSKENYNKYGLEKTIIIYNI